ncbi:MAG: nuclear transport factor 2 family protein [Bacteroidetes bacterium]|nr:nuclear transport factor 2 family protein [Bacteroidota bacterium]
MNKQLFAPLILMWLVSCASQKATPLSKDEVNAVMETFDQGWETKNAALVDSVLSPQYLYFTQSGRTFDRASLIATAGSQVYTLQTMERDNLTIQIEGNTAVVNTIWKGKGTYHGESFDDRQRCSVTITKWNGKVKILSEHCTPIK